MANGAHLSGHDAQFYAPPATARGGAPVDLSAIEAKLAELETELAATNARLDSLESRLEALENAE